MRLDRYLANSGVGTRKEVKILIHKKRVTVNGELARSDSFDVDETKDTVLVDGEPIIYSQYHYVLLNKPKGYVSAVEDNVYSPVTDLIPEFAFAHLFPVGRLDVDTTGALLLTDDGDLCHRLLSPRYHVNKTYSVTTDGTIKPSLIKEFEEGVMLDEEKTLPAKLVILDKNHAELTIHQGKFHQVKRMFLTHQLTVVELDRKTFAFLGHEGLGLGQYRELSQEEVAELKRITESK